MEDAFKVIAPQLSPLIETGKGPLDAAANDSRELRKNCFCLLQLKAYEPRKLDWVFGKIKTSTPVNTLPDNLSQTEFLIPDTSRYTGILKLTSEDLYPGGIAKTWYVRVSAWVEEDEIDQLNALAGAFHDEGFHVEPSTDLKLVSDYVGLRLDEKRRQPWVYVVSSKWLSKLGTFQLYAVKANLRLLLEYNNRIIVNLLADSAQSLNRHCDLKPGRDLLAFQEAETAAEAYRMLPDLFNNLILRPLNDLA